MRQILGGGTLGRTTGADGESTDNVRTEYSPVGIRNARAALWGTAGTTTLQPAMSGH